MGVGHRSSKPCRLCGQHKDNIVEPIRLYTTCADCRKYPTQHERFTKLMASIDLDRLRPPDAATLILAIADAKTVEDVDEIILADNRGEYDRSTDPPP